MLREDEKKISLITPIAGVILFLGVVFGTIFYILDKRVTEATILSLKSKFDRQTEYYKLLCTWLMNYDKFNFKEFFNNRGIHTVAIYGRGYIGEILKRILVDTQIEVKYFIDRDAEYIEQTDFDKTFSLDNIQDAPRVDAIIVSLFRNYHPIKKDIDKVCHDIQCIPLDHLIYGSL